MTFFRTLVIIAFIFCGFASIAQEKSIDAILKLPDDTIKAGQLKSLADSYLRQEKTDSALLCNQKAIDIYIKLSRFDKMVDA
jgi:hypothetical protein